MALSRGGQPTGCMPQMAPVTGMWHTSDQAGDRQQRQVEWSSRLGRKRRAGSRKQSSTEEAEPRWVEGS